MCALNPYIPWEKLATRHEEGAKDAKTHWERCLDQGLEVGVVLRVLQMRNLRFGKHWPWTLCSKWWWRLLEAQTAKPCLEIGRWVVQLILWAVPLSLSGKGSLKNLKTSGTEPGSYNVSNMCFLLLSSKPGVSQPQP